MQIIKSITARKIFKEYPEIKKQLWGGELWSDGGYIGTVGDGTTSDIVTNYVQNQGNQEEKQAYKQMKIIDFNKKYSKRQRWRGHTPLLAAGCASAILIESFSPWPFFDGPSNVFIGGLFKLRRKFFRRILVSGAIRKWADAY